MKFTGMYVNHFEVSVDADGHRSYVYVGPGSEGGAFPVLHSQHDA